MDTHPGTAKRKPGEISTVTDVRDIHTVMPYAMFTGQVHPGSNTTNTHPHVPQIILQYPCEPDYNTRPSPAPSNAGNLADLTQMFVTHLNKNRYTTETTDFSQGRTNCDNSSPKFTSQRTRCQRLKGKTNDLGKFLKCRY